jgi:NAD(P)-dependent dehydrogenase (short-subunit alcohol dehydrogenase family)
VTGGDPCIVVVGVDQPLGAAVVDRLLDAGCDAVGVGSGDADDADLRLAAMEAASGGRPVRAVVHAVLAADAPTPLVTLDLEGWQRRTRPGIGSAVATLLAARRLLGTGGTIAVLCPAVVLSGATGRVAEATAGEAVRQLAKSAARAWGRDGITVCSLAVVTSGAVEATTVNPPAVAPGDAATEVSSIVAYLARPGAAALAGATFTLDGGGVMAP